MQVPTIRPKSQYRRAFALCFLLAAALFLPHCIADAVWGGGWFHYAGDFNSQQVAFFQYTNQFVKQGGSYSWATDLGSGFVNAYSYYTLGNPLFWLSLWVPSSAMPWCIVPLLCLRFALAGGGAYLWARRWVREESWSLVAAVLYAFSGYMVYNVFFHFLDAVSLFPYLLAALDDAVLDGKYAPFPFWVALNLVNNYFFFAGQAVFLVLYFLCMLAGRAYKVGPRRFAALASFSLLGCAMGCILLVPAGLSLLQNPRTIDPFNGYGYLLYGNSQQYGAILYSAFLMPDAPYFKDMFEGGVFKHTSMTAYLPLVGIVGGLAFCRARRRHPFSRLLKLCVVCAFVPVLNSAFYALNSSYYARWYYMPVLVLCGATGALLSRGDLAEREVPRAWRTVALVTLSAAAFALVPNTDDDGSFRLGVVDFPPRFWGIFGVSMLGVLLFWGLWRLWHARPDWPRRLLAAVLAFTFVYGTVHLSLTKYPQWETDSDLIAETQGSVDEIAAALPNDAFYRLDVYGGEDNLGLWFNKSCLRFFSSTVDPSIMEFYPSVGVTRDVASRPDAQNYALRGLLSVRYLLVPHDQETAWAEENLTGWTPCGETSAYLLYRNDNWVPMGFAYDYYVTQEQLDAVPEEERAQILLRALLLDDGQIARYGALLDPLPDEELADRSAETYAADCAARRAAALPQFTFSVPYDDGFTATVNGQPAAIERVDWGLMAVEVPAGDADITFTYHTPGLAPAAGICLAAWAVYAAYLFVHFVKRKREPHAELR